MSLTGQNKRRREQAAEGRPGYLQKAEAHHRNAASRVDDLTDALATAKAHEESCAATLEAAQQQNFDELPAKLKAQLQEQARMAIDETEIDAPDDEPDLADLSHNELKALAKELDLKASGSKADLVARITEGKAGE